jgi:hypothetical protein|tara:strand:+ start:637 stop:1614 length:978 start_codon:yes stop_codon:yes gene_type:complete
MKLKSLEQFESKDPCECGGNCGCGNTTTKINEAKKYKFKELAKAWEVVYGEEMEDEYQGFYQEVTGKYKDKVTKDDIATIWTAVYGEDIAAEYDGFYNDLKENIALSEKLDTLNEWGSSDQASFNKSMHKEMGNPKKMPSPFDDKLRSVAADNVDHYWDDWDEYDTDREGLIDNAVRHYLRAFFKKDFEMLTRMFASNDIAEGLLEGTMGEIHALANSAKDLGEFVKKFFKEYGEKVKKTADSITWVESLYDDMVKEANADGTISDDEDDDVENMLADVEYMVDELISYIKVETKKIGGSFRSPGMEAQCLKLIKETFKKHKVRL